MPYTKIVGLNAAGERKAYALGTPDVGGDVYGIDPPTADGLPGIQLRRWTLPPGFFSGEFSKDRETIFREVLQCVSKEKNPRHFTCLEWTIPNQEPISFWDDESGEIFDGARRDLVIRFHEWKLDPSLKHAGKRYNRREGTMWCLGNQK